MVVIYAWINVNLLTFVLLANFGTLWVASVRQDINHFIGVHDDFVNGIVESDAVFLDAIVGMCNINGIYLAVKILVLDNCSLKTREQLLEHLFDDKNAKNKTHFLCQKIQNKMGKWSVRWKI